MSLKKKKKVKVQQGVIPKKLGTAYLRIGAITFVLGSFFILIGFWLDRLSGRYPVFTIVLMVISFPLILFINIKIIKKAVEKLHL